LEWLDYPGRRNPEEGAGHIIGRYPDRGSRSVDLCLSEIKLGHIGDEVHRPEPIGMPSLDCTAGAVMLLAAAERGASPLLNQFRATFAAIGRNGWRVGVLFNPMIINSII
jgi:hypothetical protein